MLEDYCSSSSDVGVQVGTEDVVDWVECLRQGAVSVEFAAFLVVLDESPNRRGPVVWGCCGSTERPCWE